MNICELIQVLMKDCRRVQNKVGTIWYWFRKVHITHIFRSTNTNMEGYSFKGLNTYQFADLTTNRRELPSSNNKVRTTTKTPNPSAPKFTGASNNPRVALTLGW